MIYINLLMFEVSATKPSLLDLGSTQQFQTLDSQELSSIIRRLF